MGKLRQGKRVGFGVECIVGGTGFHVTHSAIHGPGAVEVVAADTQNPRKGESMSRAEQNHAEEPVIRLGISRCLLGEQVRYDGGHKLDRFLVHTLGQYVEWVPVCPEVEIGLPIPRESLRLVGDAEAPRLIAPKSGTDHTDRMKAWAQGRLDELAGMDLCGFVAKKDSPSSGLFRVRVYNEHGMAQRNGTGIFPRELMNRFPLLPLEEEGRLNDMPLRENFIERVLPVARARQGLLPLDTDARE